MQWLVFWMRAAMPFSHIGIWLILSTMFFLLWLSKLACSPIGMILCALCLLTIIKWSLYLGNLSLQLVLQLVSQPHFGLLHTISNVISAQSVRSARSYPIMLQVKNMSQRSVRTLAIVLLTVVIYTGCCWTH